MLDESSAGGPPGYNVAVKTCIEAGGEGEEDMIKVRNMRDLKNLHMLALLNRWSSTTSQVTAEEMLIRILLMMFYA